MNDSVSPANSTELPCSDCSENPTGKLREIFVDVVQDGRISTGQWPAKRPVFLKPHGVAHARFEILPELPESLRVGLFAIAGSLRAWVRFSSDTLPTKPDLKTTCGIGIKVFGVPGPKLLGEGDTQDFLLQNSDIFFVDTAKDFCEFTQAGVVQGSYDPYLHAHPVTKRILDQMAKVVDSVLTTSYWSGLPYAFGEGRFVKYKLEPEQHEGTQPPDSAANYLAADLQLRLKSKEARFRFMVQFRTDPERMPLDRATVRWEESESLPVQVATLVIPQQNITELGQGEYGENLAFNPWRCLKEHEPQGSISDARKVVYAASADNRRYVNGVSLGEPDEPRASKQEEAPADDCVVKAAIFPAIGVARVGNSEEEFFYGPEVAEPLPKPWGFYRDGKGALKREAARFRVYGLNARGQAICELNASNAEVHWTAHLANKKSAWYQFQLAQDIPEVSSAIPSMLRNSTVSDRASLIIDPGSRHIHGKNVSGGPAHAFDTGKFVGKTVYLGELRTDESGRLVVLGGRGVSASFDGSKAVTFANNEGWHDDTSDGPVTAKVHYKGQELQVAPAWVIVAPPNYAPQQKSVRTMWDLMRDTAISAQMLPAPGRPSFDRDIRPIFERLSHLQWVNKGFANAFGWRAWRDLSTPEWLLRLSQNNPADQELRQTIANEFRVFDRDSWAQQTLPWLYGDAMNIPPAPTPRQNAALTDTQLNMLQQWAKGNFDSDYDPAKEPVRNLEDLPVAEQSHMLIQAAMEFCLADAFHPGCEMTWPMRHSTMYKSAFRIAHAQPGWIDPEFGAELTADTLGLRSHSPLTEQLPGGLTRWMAVPWQTDTASCRSGYQKSYDPYVPTFWPARVPNQVLSHENYEIVMDKGRPITERMAAFANRADWNRPLGLDKSYVHQINHMIHHFGDMGVVEHVDGPGDPEFPQSMEVENLPAHTHRLLTEMVHGHRGLESEQEAEETSAVDLAGIDKVRRFPHGLHKW
jgi:hypothetical protein